MLQRRLLFVPFFVLLLMIATAFSGCAVLLTSTSSKTPDLRLITPGTTRVAVEEQLGAPINDTRPDRNSGASRVCQYQYFVRESVPENVSFTDKVKNKMLGFRQVHVTVFYNQRDQVLRMNVPMARLADGSK